MTGDPQNGKADFRYDPLGRLSEYTPPGSPLVPYGWDRVPNRTSAGRVTTTFDAANRPTSTGFASDLDGRITAIPARGGAPAKSLAYTLLTVAIVALAACSPNADNPRTLSPKPPSPRASATPDMPAPQPNPANSPEGWRCMWYPDPDATRREEARGPLLMVANDETVVVAAPFDVDFGTGFAPLVDGTWIDTERAQVRSDMWVSDAARQGARLLAVGGLAPDPDTGAQEGAAWVSADGLAWTDLPLPWTLRERMIQKVAVSDDTLLATDGQALFVSASAGGMWDRVPLDGVEVRINDLAYAPALLVAVGGDSQGAVAWISADGRVWERSRFLDPARELRTVEAAGSTLVAVGTTAEGQTSWWISGDAGLTWTRETSREAPSPANAKLAGTTAGVLAVTVGVEEPDVASIWRMEQAGAWQRLAAGRTGADIADLEAFSLVLTADRLTIAFRTKPAVVPEWLGFCSGRFGSMP